MLRLRAVRALGALRPFRPGRPSRPRRLRHPRRSVRQERLEPQVAADHRHRHAQRAGGEERQQVAARVVPAGVLAVSDPVVPRAQQFVTGQGQPLFGSGRDVLRQPLPGFELLALRFLQPDSGLGQVLGGEPVPVVGGQEIPQLLLVGRQLVGHLGLERRDLGRRDHAVRNRFGRLADLSRAQRRELFRGGLPKGVEQRPMEAGAGVRVVLDAPVLTLALAAGVGLLLAARRLHEVEDRRAVRSGQAQRLVVVVLVQHRVRVRHRVVVGGPYVRLGVGLRVPRPVVLLVGVAGRLLRGEEPRPGPLHRAMAGFQLLPRLGVFAVGGPQLVAGLLPLLRGRARLLVGGQPLLPRGTGLRQRLAVTGVLRPPLPGERSRLVPLAGGGLGRVLGVQQRVVRGRGLRQPGSGLLLDLLHGSGRAVLRRLVRQYLVRVRVPRRGDRHRRRLVVVLELRVPGLGRRALPFRLRPPVVPQRVVGGVPGAGQPPFRPRPVPGVVGQVLVQLRVPLLARGQLPLGGVVGRLRLLDAGLGLGGGEHAPRLGIRL